MKALVVGLGSIGCRHLNNLRALGVKDLAAFRMRKQPPPREIPPGTVILHDYSEALAGGPDIVVIANPTSMHVHFAREALEHGCHVYLEKPVSHSLDGVPELQAVAERSGRVVLVGCQLRYHPGLQRVREWIDAGRAGRIMTVQVDMGEHLPDWHPWEDYRTGYAARVDQGGGVVLTLIHELDYCHWLFGPASNVYAKGGRKTPLDLADSVDDTAMVTIETTRGTIAQLRMDYWRSPPVRRFSAVGTEAEIHWDYRSGQTALLTHGRREPVEQLELPPEWDRNDLFLAAMRDFLHAIRSGSPPAVSLADGVNVLKTALAAKESMRDGQARSPAL